MILPLFSIIFLSKTLLKGDWVTAIVLISSPYTYVEFSSTLKKWVTLALPGSISNLLKIKVYYICYFFATQQIIFIYDIISFFGFSNQFII